MKGKTLEQFEKSHGGGRIQELQSTINALARNRKKITLEVPTERNTIRFGLIGDTQLGSLYEAKDCLKAFYARIAKEEISLVLHTGDVLDGHKVYKGQEFELHALGWQKQRDWFAQVAPKVEGVTTYFITGNHDLSLKKLAGIDVGPELEHVRPDWKFLGEDSGTVTLTTKEGKELVVMLLHPGGGSAYAVSYRAQKIVEQIEGGRKPNVICFPKGTRVTLANGTEKDISDIVVGDHVITHTGVAKPVTKTFTHDGTTGYNIALYGRTSSTVRCTDEHPLFVLRDGVKQWVAVQDLRKSDWVASPIVAGEEEVVINFVDHISKHFYRIEGEVVVGQNGKQYPATITIDEKFARLLGLYVAEGYNDLQMYRMCFAFDQCEEEYKQFVSQMFRDAFQKEVTIEDRADSQTRVIKVNDMMLTDLFATMVGSGASNKSLPDWCLRLPKHVQKALLQGLFEGDGCKSETYYELCTISEKLVHQVMLIAARIGLAAGYSCQTRRGEGRKPEYTIRVHHNNDLGEKWYNEGTINQTPTNKMIVNDGEHVWHHVRFVEPITLNEPVYNLEVENDQSYIANGICAHNCIGHFHKAEFLPSYRNVACLQSGCFQFQTPFMLTRGLAAHVGGWIVRIVPGDFQMAISAEFVAFYADPKRDEG